LRRILQVLPFFARRACPVFGAWGAPGAALFRRWAGEWKYGIITSKPPLARLRVRMAHAPVLTHRVLRTLNHAKPQQVRFCCGRFAASWYNNLKAAACAAARVHGTRPCADAQGFENIGPCKTAIDAVLLRPLRGVMVYYDHRQKQCGDIGCIR